MIATPAAGTRNCQRQSERKITPGRKFYALTAFLYALLVAACYLAQFGPVRWLAVCYGGAISLGLSWLGFALLMKVPGSDSNRFLKLVLGGMAARMLVALLMVVLGIGVLKLPSGELIGSCMVSYVVFVTLEHSYALPSLKRKNNNTG